MRKRLEVIHGILFLSLMVGHNADPIDESRKWGNITEMALDR